MGDKACIDIEIYDDNIKEYGVVSIDVDNTILPDKYNKKSVKELLTTITDSYSVVNTQPVCILRVENNTGVLYDIPSANLVEVIEQEELIIIQKEI